MPTTGLQGDTMGLSSFYIQGCHTLPYVITTNGICCHDNWATCTPALLERCRLQCDGTHATTTRMCCVLSPCWHLCCFDFPPSRSATACGIMLQRGTEDKHSSTDANTCAFPGTGKRQRTATLRHYEVQSQANPAIPWLPKRGNTSPTPAYILRDIFSALFSA
jgi:hypothetical protein